METLSIYGEFLDGLQKLTLTICGDLPASCTVKVAKPNVLSIIGTTAQINVVFDNLLITPTSCSIIPGNSPKTESYSVLAKCILKSRSDERHKEIGTRLIGGDMLRCKFCESNIAKISDIKKIDTLLPIDSFAGSEPNTFFCHAKSNVTEQPYCPLSRAVANLQRSVILCNDVEFLLHPDSWIQTSTMTVSGSEGLFCNRCRLMLGRMIGSGDDLVPVLWTNNVTVWTEELDVDGCYLRHVEIPLIPDDVDFCDALFAQLLENKCYRVILSAGTADGLVDYALIWLFDQHTCLYSATVDLDVAQPSADGDALDKSSEKEQPQDIHPEQTAVTRVLYKILLVPKGLNSSGTKDASLDEWSHDFSVTHITLPWETCVLLSTCLTQVTHRLPPHMRNAAGNMAEFTVGGIPTRT